MLSDKNQKTAHRAVFLWRFISSLLYHETKPDLVTTKNYRIRAAIKTGAKGELGHYSRTRTRVGPYSGSSGALFMLNGGQIPAYRDSGNRKDIKVWKTLSAPQMVSNEEVYEAYMKRITTETDKLIDRYYDLLVD